MKVPPKRKGNIITRRFPRQVITLNESPSEKEGKLGGVLAIGGSSSGPQ